VIEAVFSTATRRSYFERVDRRGDGSYPPPPGTDEHPDAGITSLQELAGVLTGL
jgi:hypothetical protein